MTTKYVQDGRVIQYTNTGAAKTSGQVIVIGANNDAMLGVAMTDIAATTGVGSVAIQGVFKLPAASAAVIKAGERVMWDVSAGEFDDNLATPAAGDVSEGATAVADSGNGVTTVDVLLTPGTGTIT